MLRIFQIIINFFKNLFFRKKSFYKQAVKSEKEIEVYRFSPSNKKPDWVKKEVIYLKALLPDYGCRKIADSFNRLHVKESVSKSYVNGVISKNSYEINDIYKRFKNRIPKKMPKNLIWNVDLTSIDKKQVFGVVDAGSRALVLLQHVKDKSSVTLVRALLDVVEKFGQPKLIKSDNEAVFTSWVFKTALFILGIKHKTTELASPWQNGKIERLFLTLKSSFRGLVFPNSKSLETGLAEFRFFYNHVRPHQHLYGKTPFEAWNGKDKLTCKNSRDIYFYEGLCGNIAGFYFRE